MTDKHSYPKSSCSCYNCEKDNLKVSTGHPTNFSVRSCTVGDHYGCYDNRVFRAQMEPVKKHGINVLNPQVISSDRLANNFDKVTCVGDSECQTSFITMDPRLFDAARGTHLKLDRPPNSSSVKLKDLYTDPSLDCYGKNYRTYSDINAGQIVYYIDEARSDTFYKPLFSKKARVLGVLYKDPMSNMKPHYERIPNQDCLSNPTLETNEDEETCDSNPYCLSWMKDTQDHREDLLSRQMQKINQTRWEPRWASPSNV